MTFFSPKADEIVGVNCEALVNSLQNPSPREFPEQILAVIGKHTFSSFIITNLQDKRQLTSFWMSYLTNQTSQKKLEIYHQLKKNLYYLL